MPYMDSDTNRIREQQVYRNLLDGKYPPETRRKEFWNRPGLRDIVLDPYRCPVQGKTFTAWETYLRVFVGPGAAFESGKLLSPKDFTDGVKNTILVVEAAEPVPWPKPDELRYDPNKPLPRLGGVFDDGFYALFADGVVRFIPTDINEKVLRAMITRNGGEKIETLPPAVDDEALRSAAGFR